MKVFAGAIFLFTSLFVALVLLVDGSNSLIEMQRDVLALQKEKEKVQHRVVELEYLHTLKTSEKELLKKLSDKTFSHLEFRSEP